MAAAPNEPGPAGTTVASARRPPDARDTGQAFGVEWTLHGQLSDLYASEEDLHEEFNSFGVPDEFFRGKRVLDAGCGMGRYSFVAAKRGARRVVAFDLHDGVLSARRVTAGLPVTVLKANIFAPPFRPASFDSIMSIGVLHHTGDMAAAFRRLVSLVRPGGEVFVQVYATRGGARDRRDRYLLAVTRRMPGWLLYGVSILLVGMMSIPLLRNVLRLGLHYVTFVGYSRRRTFWRNVADTYDWLCPPFRSFHTSDEMVALFRECDLLEIRITNPAYRGAVNILGRKPAPGGFYTGVGT